MDLKIAARMIAVLAIGAAMIAAVAALREAGSEETTPATHLRDPGGEPASAPFGRSELARCRDIGAAALEDAACRKAWAENRRRFFHAEQPERPPMPTPERFGKAPIASGARTDTPNAVDEELAL